MAAEDLLEDWRNLSLTAEEEEIAVDVDRDAVEDTGKALSMSLMGKLLAGRTISCEIIKNTMKSA